MCSLSSHPGLEREGEHFLLYGGWLCGFRDLFFWRLCGHGLQSFSMPQSFLKSQIFLIRNGKFLHVKIL